MHSRKLLDYLCSAVLPFHRFKIILKDVLQLTRLIKITDSLKICIKKED